MKLKEIRALEWDTACSTTVTPQHTYIPTHSAIHLHLNRTALHYITLYCSALHYIIPYCLWWEQVNHETENWKILLDVQLIEFFKSYSEASATHTHIALEHPTQHVHIHALALLWTLNALDTCWVCFSCWAGLIALISTLAYIVLMAVQISHIEHNIHAALTVPCHHSTPIRCLLLVHSLDSHLPSSSALPSPFLPSTDLEWCYQALHSWQREQVAEHLLLRERQGKTTLRCVFYTRGDGLSFQRSSLYHAASLADRDTHLISYLFSLLFLSPLDPSCGVPHTRHAPDRTGRVSQSRLYSSHQRIESVLTRAEGRGGGRGRVLKRTYLQDLWGGGDVHGTWIIDSRQRWFLEPSSAPFLPLMKDCERYLLLFRCL